MGPFALEDILGKAGAYLIYLLIGVCFGAVLEMAGFADSRRLAAQFYFKNQTVFKVMFTAIITAMVLIFATSSLNLLDYNRLWVNPTYLMPGIVGGLIMGVGFIIGGFCPGTSLVAVATLKIDGLFFFLGASAGIFLFGETVGWMEGFWYSSYMGRFTLQEWLGVDAGLVALMVVGMALFMFWGAEKLEAVFGDGPPPGGRRFKRFGAVALVLMALLAMGMGQPTLADRWERMATEKEPLLLERQVQIHPGELLGLMHDDQLNLIVLDVRDEAGFNLFHLADAKRVTMAEVENGSLALGLLAAPTPSVIVLIGSGEERATQAWKMLVAQSVLNVYLLDEGIEHWLAIFGHEGHEQCAVEDLEDGKKRMLHVFRAALGADQAGADPDPEAIEELEFTAKVKIQRSKVLGGGCG